MSGSNSTAGTHLKTAFLKQLFFKTTKVQQALTDWYAYLYFYLALYS